MTCINKAISLNPRNTFALTGKDDYLLKLRNYTGAIEYANKALDIDPNDTNAQIIKGFALDISGNHTESIKYFNKSLENRSK
jgi:tetratricopeptide (TPR) repeat protein